MPLQAKRVLSLPFKYAMYFDGVDDYVKVEPFSVFGWSEYTFMSWIYLPPILLSGTRKTAMIGRNVPVVYWYGSWIELTYSTYFTIWGCILWRPSDNARYDVRIAYRLSDYLGKWTHVAYVVSKTAKRVQIYVNSDLVKDVDISSYLNAGYITPMDDNRIFRFNLGCNYIFSEFAPIIHENACLYSRALSQAEIQYNMNYPDNPVRNGLVLWLQAHPSYVKDIENDGILEWIDLSGFNNHGKIYGAQLVELIKSPSRVIQAQRVLACAR
jgi:hypothetical protein